MISRMQMNGDVTVGNQDRHRGSHRLEGDTAFRCKVCKFTFMSKFAAIQHGIHNHPEYAEQEEAPLDLSQATSNDDDIAERSSAAPDTETDKKEAGAGLPLGTPMFPPGLPYFMPGLAASQPNPFSL